MGFNSGLRGLIVIQQSEGNFLLTNYISSGLLLLSLWSNFTVRSGRYRQPLLHLATSLDRLWRVLSRGAASYSFIQFSETEFLQGLVWDAICVFEQCQTDRPSVLYKILHDYWQKDFRNLSKGGSWYPSRSFAILSLLSSVCNNYKTAGEFFIKFGIELFYWNLSLYECRQNSSVGRTILRLDNSFFWIQEEARDISISWNTQTIPGVHSDSYSMSVDVVSRGNKATEKWNWRLTSIWCWG
jgi:hypothetical protein